MKKNTPLPNKYKARRLRQTNRYIESEEIYNELFLIDKNLFEPIDVTTYIWDIYLNHIRSYDIPEEMEEYARFIKENFAQSDCRDSNYNDPYAMAMLRTSSNYINEGDYYKAISYIYHLNYEFLSEKVRLDKKSKAYKYSQRERYYSNLVKSLIGLKKHDHALEYIDKALELFKESKSPIIFWMSYQKAKALNLLEQYEQSIDILEAIKEDNEYPAIYNLLSDDYRKIGDDKNALKAAIKSAMINEESNSYCRIAEILESMDDKIMAYKHYYLAYLHKKENGKFVESILEEKINSFGMDLYGYDYNSLKEEIEQFWREAIKENFKGTISRVISDEGHGFIRKENSDEEIMFDFNDFLDDPAYIFDNIKVSFTLDSSDDKKAIEIRLI